MISKNGYLLRALCLGALILGGQAGLTARAAEPGAAAAQPSVEASATAPTTPTATVAVIKGGRGFDYGQFNWPLVSAGAVQGNLTKVTKLSVLKLPLAGMEVFEDGGLSVSEQGTTVPNPFRFKQAQSKRAAVLADVPLLSLYDLTLIEKARPACPKAQPCCAASEPPLARRVRVLDSPVLCAWRSEQWVGGQRYVEALDVPLLTIFAMENSQARRGIQVAEGPGVTLYTKEYTAKENSTQTRLADLLLVSLFRREQGPGADYKSMLNVSPLGCSLVSSSRIEVRHTLSILGMFNRREERPAFALWVRQDMEEGPRTHQLLRLPLMGPLWAAWRPMPGQPAQSALFPRWRQGTPGAVK